jgi:hypothetical protein
MLRRPVGLEVGIAQHGPIGRERVFVEIHEVGSRIGVEQQDHFVERIGREDVVVANEDDMLSPRRCESLVSTVRAGATALQLH